MMIIAAHDTQTPTAWQREAYEGLGEPKALTELDCRHYDVYMSHREVAAEAAVQWFLRHL